LLADGFETEAPPTKSSKMLLSLHQDGKSVVIWAPCPSSLFASLFDPCIFPGTCAANRGSSDSAGAFGHSILPCCARTEGGAGSLSRVTTHRSYPSHPPLPRLATATLIFIPHPYHLPSSPDTGQRPPGLTVPLGPLASQPPPTAWIPPLFFPRHRNRGLRAMLPLHLIPPSLRLRGSLIPEISPNK